MYIQNASIQKFEAQLREEDKSELTIRKYLHDVNCFREFSQSSAINKNILNAYKEYLGNKYAISSANSMIASLNSFLRYDNHADLCIKQFKVQKKAYCSEAEELTKEEYIRLVTTAESKSNERLSLILQTVCATGIRISELQHITVEAIINGEALVNCKSKIRTVFIVSSLQKKLLNYAQKHNISSGAIFCSKNGIPLNRCNIWREMKKLCEKASVSPKKVFPHNLRHLFARTFYGIEKDIAKLADVLGHTNINTTRIYIISSGKEHKKKMENMRLII